jgi:NTE family protein
MKRLLIWLFCAGLAATMMASEPARRPRIGLVLGGGGAKGAAEVGALKVIEEAGIPIDCIAGTSIGSIVGGLYAVGYRADALDSLFCSQEWLSLLADRADRFKDKILTEEEGVTYIFGIPVSRVGSKHANPLFGAVKGDNIIELFQKLTQTGDSINFNELPIPFRCVAADLKEGCDVVLDCGSLPIAMRASMAIPGVFKPVRRGKRVLFDGGLYNNLPADVVKAMGADIIIAIDLTQEKEKPRSFSLKESWGIGGLADWVISRPDIKRYEQNCKLVDVYICPALGKYGVTSFSRESIGQMIRLGEEAARSKWDELMTLRQLTGEGGVTSLE